MRHNVQRFQRHKHCILFDYTVNFAMMILKTCLQADRNEQLLRILVGMGIGIECGFKIWMDIG